jgi:excisionase family DNA binding protein
MFDQQFLDRLADAIADRLLVKLTAERTGIHAVPPRLMDVAAAAVYLGRSVGAVEQLVKRGRIPTVRIDTKIQIDRRALDRLIENSTVEAAA